MYLDTVGKIHTPAAGNPELNVPLVQMNALMGFVHDAINATILGFNIPEDAKGQAIRSFSKLLWIQSDLITRHYTARAMAAADARAHRPEAAVAAVTTPATDPHS
jgi:hypothetical protein